MKLRASVLLKLMVFLVLCGWAFENDTHKLAHNEPNYKRPSSWDDIKHVVIIFFENGNPDDAMKQPYFNYLANKGANFKSYYGVTHPSQPNYIASVAGSYFGITTDDNVNLNKNHVGDLLEGADKSWKVYAEDYPGNCFLGSRNGQYARKHVPFLSFKNIQQDSDRCKNIVSSEQFDVDVANNSLPNYSLYIPNLNSDGHDTGLEYASGWLKRTLGRYLEDPNILKDTLFIITFDEDDHLHLNRIYTVFLGAAVKNKSTSSIYNHYSMLRTIEEIYQIGNLGRNDATASIILDIWK